jgi:hypothetical protein
VTELCVLRGSTVSVRVPTVVACRRISIHQLPNSTRYFSTTMPGINDALRQINRLKPGEKICYTRIAKNARCDPVMLVRHHKGVQADRDTKNLRQLKVTPQQENELVQYIIRLTERSSPPTRQMIINLVRGLAKVKVSQTWITRFLQRHRDVLTNPYTNPMASVRHAADSYDKYRA